MEKGESTYRHIHRTLNELLLSRLLQAIRLRNKYITFCTVDWVDETR